MDRWTIKQLNDMDDLSFAIAILNERRSKVTPYSPLGVKLAEAAHTLAEYRFTDLKPEQIEALQEENLKLTTPDAMRQRQLELIAEKAEAHGGINHLVALDEAAMEGRLVILPCRIDAPIYLIHQEEKQPRKPQTYRVEEYHIDHFTIGGAMIPMITACGQENEWEELIDGTQQGQEYFLSREAAEKAIGGDNE